MSGYTGAEPIPKATRVRTFGTLGSATATIPVPATFTPGNIEVFVNGDYVQPTDYDDSDGNNVVMNETLPIGTDYIVMEARGFQQSGAALLAGGSSANFVTMPQVGGDPIVESGSNADGQWTKWSEGTAVISQNLTASGVGFLTWTYPIQMPSRDGAGALVVAAENSVAVTVKTASINPDDLRYATVQSSSDTYSPNSFRIMVFGRWK